MSVLKVLGAIALFLVLIGLFLLFGLEFGWAAFFGGVFLIFILAYFLWEPMDTISGFPAVYRGVNEDNLDFYELPTYDELVEMEDKEIIPFGDPVGKYWHLNYFEESTGKRQNAFITKSSKIVAKFEGSFPHQDAVRMYMSSAAKRNALPFGPSKSEMGDALRELS